jgi:hypothetical protein
MMNALSVSTCFILALQRDFACWGWLAVTYFRLFAQLIYVILIVVTFLVVRVELIYIFMVLSLFMTMGPFGLLGGE